MTTGRSLLPLVNIINFGLSYSNAPKWSFYLGNRFIDNFSSSVVVSTNWRPSEKWRLMFYEKYDFRAKDSNVSNHESQNLNTAFTLSRFFHDWIGNLTIKVDDVRGDTITRFDITPRGAGTANNRFWLF